MQFTNKRFFGVAGALAMAVAFAGYSYAGSLVVNATDVIYAAGSQSAEAATASGTIPGGISIPGGTSSVTFSSVTGSLTCSSPEGCITLDSTTGDNLNDPDGVGAQPSTSSNTGYGSISGITTAPGAGYLTGVFVALGGPSGPMPSLLSYPSGFTNASYSPLLDQVFIIGDGKTGDGTGSTQVFNVPSGAVVLYLGISDASGYNGAPGSYNDNAGTFTVNYTLTALPPTPVPPSIFLTLIGLACGALYIGYNGLHFPGGQKA